MDSIDMKYSLTLADHGREVWMNCSQCRATIKAYASSGFSMDVADIRAETAKHEKNVHTERTTFSVYSIYADGVWNRTIDLTMHKSAQCSGKFCVVHRPSMHHMRFWPILFDREQNYMAFRICQHSAYHPDPDSLAHLKHAGLTGAHDCCAELCCEEN